jgi:hypothetical protein
LRQNGFSIRLANRAFLSLDSYIYGFVFQEVTWPREILDSPSAITQLIASTPIAQYPYLVEQMNFVLGSMSAKDETTGPYDAEFEFGLTMILDGLARALADESRIADAAGTKT